MNNQTLGQFFYSSNKASSDLMLETSLIVMYYCIVSGLKKKEFGSRNRVLFGAGAKLLFFYEKTAAQESFHKIVNKFAVKF